MGKYPEVYYAVHKGRRPGIYSTWKACEEEVKGYTDARFKKFKVKKEADNFVLNGFKSLGASQPYSTKRRSKSPTKKPKLSTQSSEILNYQIVFTDGSSRGNGTKNSRAGYGVYFGENDPRNCYGRIGGRQTNQRAEVTAAIKALEVTDPNVHLEIRTDSQYLIKAITTWIINWKRNGWKSSTGKDVENKELFVLLNDLISNRKGKVKWFYVPGHKGIEGNEMADQLANMGAELSDIEQSCLKV